ncbi:hypothetical protein Nepgr_032033 [Nepenthes gracilis]|uniref:DRBM domain-containing protein n=1 Tax=Nepenthes gracilis TaxID=150966 RepID=A0AAD3TIJ6_NEPGR|nr:hypothetical protein Nepgr_032033 [Nepenthes gracilis]
MFFSSLVFHGVTYTGEVGRNKKEAEQLAARAVLLSILGNSDSQTFLFEIIKAKAALFAGIHKFKEPPTLSNVPMDSNLGSGFGMSGSKEREFDDVTRVGTVVRTAALEGSYGQASNHPKMHQPLHELVEQEQVSEGISLPITFVPALQGQPPLLSLGSVMKRSRKNKKKAKKKLKSDTKLPVSVLSLNEVSPCTVAH